LTGGGYDRGVHRYYIVLRLVSATASIPPTTDSVVLPNFNPSTVELEVGALFSYTITMTTGYVYW